MPTFGDARELTLACVAKAERIYGVDLSELSIRFDLKGTAAGTARRYGRTFRYELNYNKDAMRMNWNHFVRDTIPHEVAHLTCFAKPSLGSGHDSGWKAVCLRLGGTGKQYYSANDFRISANTRQSLYEYTTDTGGTIKVTENVHNAIQVGNVYTTGKGKLAKTSPYKKI